jgi:hypothetical protein
MLYTHPSRGCKIINPVLLQLAPREPEWVGTREPHANSTSGFYTSDPGLDIYILKTADITDTSLANIYYSTRSVCMRSPCMQIKTELNIYIP